EGHASLASALIAVVEDAESHDARPPEHRRLASDLAEQIAQHLCIRPTCLVGHRIQERLDISGCWLHDGVLRHGSSVSEVDVAYGGGPTWGPSRGFGAVQALADQTGTRAVSCSTHGPASSGRGRGSGQAWNQRAASNVLAACDESQL